MLLIETMMPCRAREVGDYNISVSETKNKTITFYTNTQEKWSNSEIIGKTNAKLSGCNSGWMPVVREYIPNYHECLSSRKIKLRQMVTLAYIHYYVWLTPGSIKPLANGSAQKYYCYVESGEKTYAISTLVLRRKQEDLLCWNCLYRTESADI